LTPALIRESLTLSRNAGLPFPVAWEIATTDHPLEDFMEGCFSPEHRDTEGKDFKAWSVEIWRKAYEGHSPAKKPTRLEPSGMPSIGVSVAYNGSQGHGNDLHGESRTVDEAYDSSRGKAGDELSKVKLRGSSPRLPTASPRRCKSGDRCDREGGHGTTGKFCERHAGELERIRRVHGLDQGFDWDERSTATYAGRFG
jgi:hypothetical protein